MPDHYLGSVNRITSKGVAVELKLYHKIDDGIKDGWIVDLVEAHTDNGPAGYLKIAFIPEDERQRWFPDAFIWQAREGGSGWDWKMRDFIDRPDSEWTRDEIEIALRVCDLWPHRFDSAESRERLRTLSNQEIFRLWQERRQEITAEYQRAYNDFCRQLVDLPYIEYIRVYNENGHSPYIDGSRLDNASVQDHQRQGIGTVLYETGALWMHARGLLLHASGNQSQEAQGAWTRLRDRGLVGTVHEANKTRQVFNAQKLLAENPDLRLDLSALQ